jgi:soluble lytic murein transglycosylase-like protein
MGPRHNTFLTIPLTLAVMVSISFSIPAGCHPSDDGYCFESISKISGIPAELLMAISYVESNHTPDAINFNKNGSVDYGHMQINSIWVSLVGNVYLELNDPCLCTTIGAYILSDCIGRYGYNTDAISCYNTGRPLKQLSGERKKAAQNYIKKVSKRYKLMKPEASDR